MIAVLNEMNTEHTPETLKAPGDGNSMKEKLEDRYTEEDLKDILDADDRADRAGKTYYKGYL